MDECCDRLNKILDDKDVMAVLYLCDKYPLKDAPGEDAGTVCDVDCGTTLYLNSVTYLNGYWFDVTVYTESGEARGFVPMDKLICVDEDYLKWEKGLLSAGDGAGTGDVLSKDGSTADGNVSDKTYTDAISVRARESVYSFPDSYRDKLFAILNKHPDWVFVPQKVGSTLSAAVSAELEDKNRNWVYYTVDDRFKGAKINSSWYYASRAGLEYYMNPANFVGSEQNIFMFEQLTYNASYHTQEGVQSVLKGSFMSGEVPSEGMTYAGAFYTIGSSLKVSPYHLAARVYQEQGSKGTSPLISGTYSGFEGYYNYFNIKASGSTNAEIYKNGLTYARQQGWNTRYKSLAGGSAFDSKNYILAGQDTPYLEKYNVVKKVYWHQYMQNASAPLTEASKVYKMYKNSGALDNPFVFKIPVYDGDPISPAKPKVSVSLVKKSNLFYTCDTEEIRAQVKLTAEAEIKSVTADADADKDNAASGFPYFTYESFDASTGIVTLKPVGLTPENYKKVQKKVTLDITVEGFDTFAYAFNIAFIDSKPVIKAPGTVLYGELNFGSIALNAPLPAGTTVTCTDPNMTVTLNGTRDAVEFETLFGFRAGTKRLEFCNDIWRIPYPVNTAIKNKALPVPKLYKTGIKLNSALDCDLYGMADTQAYLPGNLFDIKLVDITGVNAAAQQLLDSGFLKTEISGDKVSFGLKPDLRGSIRAGVYKFDISAAMADPKYSMMTVRSTRISIGIIDKDPAAFLAFSGKGGIKLSDSSSYIQYTPKIVDLNATYIKQASLEGENADLFDVFVY
ncbi:MAG: hypothetical protein IKX95_03010, partial [Lachnospiraceae bacterium]|nr:hypothetical protein [Lachnospiraceae bacterium]